MPIRIQLTSFVAIALVFSLAACSVNVKKDNNGEKKNVDIETPFGGIHVNENADVRDTGLPVYPGARPKPKDDSNDEKSANVNISAGGFGIKVVALQYETDDSPAKVESFYQDQLKKFGSVLKCHSSGHARAAISRGDGMRAVPKRARVHRGGDGSGLRQTVAGCSFFNVRIISKQDQRFAVRF